MADVFISYAKSERPLTAELAQHLESEGYKVWWDTELLTGDSFREKIDEELNLAKAIIVVWTPTSVKREWVIAEAEHAAQRGIMLPVRTADLDPNQIPKPYSTRHTELISNRDAIIAGLKRLQVFPRYAAGADGSLHDRFWREIDNSTHIGDYELYLKEFPEGRHAAFARLKIEQLKRAGQSGATITRESQQGFAKLIPYLTMLLTSCAGTAIAGAVLWQAALVPDQATTRQRLDRLAKDVVQTGQQQSAQINDLSERAGIMLAEVQRHLKPDDDDWARADNEGLIASWSGYVARRPIGLHEQEARARIRERLDADRLIETLEGHAASITSLESTDASNELVSYDKAGWQIVWELSTRSAKSRTKLAPAQVPKSQPSNTVNIPNLQCSGRYPISGEISLEVDSCGIGWVRLRSIQAGVSLGNGGFPALVQQIGSTLFRFKAQKEDIIFDLAKSSAKRLAEPLEFVSCQPTQGICITSRANALGVLDLNFETLFNLPNPFAEIKAAILMDNSPIAITGGDDGLIRLWDLSEPRMSRTAPIAISKSPPSKKR